MRIVGINASARVDGLTGELLDAVLQGASEGGGTTSTVNLFDKEIDRCRMCDEKGWGLCRAEGHCVIDDDLAPIIDELVNADGFVLATPVYYGDLSESARALIDRMRRVVCSPAHESKPLAGKRCVAIAAAGGGGGGSATCLVSMEKALQTCGCFVVDMIPAAQRNRHYKADVARLAGRGLVVDPSSD